MKNLGDIVSIRKIGLFDSSAGLSFNLSVVNTQMYIGQPGTTIDI